MPAGEAWRDNLGYTVLDGFGFTLHWAVRLGLAGLALIVATDFGTTCGGGACEAGSRRLDGYW